VITGKGMPVEILLKAVDRASGPIRAVMGQLRQLETLRSAGTAYRSSGREMLKAGAGMIAGAGLIGGALYKITRPSADLEEELKVLKTVTVTSLGSIDEAVARSKKAALDWQSTWGVASEDFVRANYNMAGASLNAEDALAGTMAAARLAKATRGDIGDASKLLATMFNLNGDRTKDAGEQFNTWIDRLTQTQQQYQLENLGQLQSGFLKFLPAGNSVGMDMSETMAATGALNNQGIVGPEAGTAAVGFMNTALKASKEFGFAMGKNADGGMSFIKTLQNIEAKLGKFTDMTTDQRIAVQDTFGEVGTAVIKAFSGKLGEVEQGMWQVARAEGVVDTALRTLAEGSNERWRAVTGNLRTTTTEVGDNLGPAIQGLEAPFADAVSGLRKFNAEYPGVVRLASYTLILTAFILGMAGSLKIARGAWLLTKGEALLTYTAHGRRACSGCAAKGQLLAAALAPVWGHVLYIGRAFLYMGRAAVLGGLAMLATPWGVAIGALLAVGAAIAYVVSPVGRADRPDQHPRLGHPRLAAAAEGGHGVQDAVGRRRHGGRPAEAGGVAGRAAASEGFDAEFWRTSQPDAGGRDGRRRSMSACDGGRPSPESASGGELALAGGTAGADDRARAGQDSDEGDGLGMGLDSLGRLWERMLVTAGGGQRHPRSRLATAGTAQGHGPRPDRPRGAGGQPIARGRG
jgi:TP901 family phage tail tape measure protein